MQSVKVQIQTGKVGVILATDCGSTTSKARLFIKKSDGYRFIVSGEAPTTVEAPYEDVTLGVRNAIREIEELTGRTLLSEDGIISPCDGNLGCDLYVTTSSAGGGLQMIVAGVIKTMSAESAERAALGAGAIVMDAIATDDDRRPHERISVIRHLRPDMILVAGGTDGGTVDLVCEIAEMIATAEPKARLGAGYELPIVYAGNKDARTRIKELLATKFALSVVDNIRPVLEVENSEPAREAVHHLFMEHVMSHAPGYERLMKWAHVPIMPTPAAEGAMFRTMAEKEKINVIGVGLGGATTNVYSVYDGRFVRTVSANLGMSYSICNVLKEAGIKNICRWLPFEMDETTLRNILRNKMIRPTTIPETTEELIIEHAVAREALRLGFNHHKSLARGLRGVRRQREIGEIFEQKMETASYIDMLRINMLAGTGGLLSHAPRRAQTVLILIDSFQPEGVTKLAQDSVFMIPHLGVLSTVHPQAALEIFEKDCLVNLGTCISPRTCDTSKKDSEIPNDATVTVEGTTSHGGSIHEEVRFGEINRIRLGDREVMDVEIRPAKGFDVGTGSGASLKTRIEGGVVGVIMDGRGRPLELPQNDLQRRRKLLSWIQSLDAYPEDALRNYERGMV